MKAYVLSLAIGILVGILYALFQVRSPAPPIIALVGLLGILVGEQVPSVLKQAWNREGFHASAPAAAPAPVHAPQDNERVTK